ncbi:uncharacterized protein L203_101998 [Cryptococcus depauperatus CBS 7841]|uniref:Uncharacterized protein n=1 Tax=Cryptococcus depauperatus CBS 7841 TaxID=1295531 RepID=A0A1E3IR89_9TREE|nr:hypothetical protein L203_01249 [Cryptococcus depauperatus CBS 7841]
MLYKEVAIAFRSHFVEARSRGIATALPALRQQERLPRGHVRPTRKHLISRPIGQSNIEGEPDVHVTPIQPVHSVYIPPDTHGVLGDNHAAKEILGHESLVIVRQLEMLNIFMGFEQANRYAIHSSDGQHVGFLAEEEQGIFSTMNRQILRTHRPFRSLVMDRFGKPVLWIRRPFSFINSRISVHSSQDLESKLVGETQQQWHPWRRRYNLFQSRNTETLKQFAKIDGGFWTWDFWLKDRDDRLIASINRNFRGFGRELFTDTGQYVIRFDAAGTELDIAPGSKLSLQGQTLIMPRTAENGLTLDQRAMTLATAVSIDFDYFSRHSETGAMGFPFFWWGGGEGADAQAGPRPSSVPPNDAKAASTAGMMGATNAVGEGDLTEDELVYGRQSPGSVNSKSDEVNEPSQGYGQDDQEWSEQTMRDPWPNQGDNDGDWWGGGDGGFGDDGGTW